MVAPSDLRHREWIMKGTGLRRSRRPARNGCVQAREDACMDKGGTC